MKPPDFRYYRASSVEDALTLLRQCGGDTKIIAGGQSLVPMMNFRMASPKALIDINRLGELAFHRVNLGQLCIGALERHAVLRSSHVVHDACPLVAEAYKYVAHPAIRNRGTLGGNLCHADPASEMPSVMKAVDATLVIRSLDRVRLVPAEEFFLGLYETDIKFDEMLVEVRIPIANAGQGWGFHEISVRQGDFAIVAVAATLSLQNERVIQAAISVAGTSPTAVRLAKVEQKLTGELANDSTLSEAGLLAAQCIDPHSDPNADSIYRKDLIRVLVTRALRDARNRAMNKALTGGNLHG